MQRRWTISHFVISRSAAASRPMQQSISADSIVQPWSAYPPILSLIADIAA
jgi:hypothetical protein